MANKTSIQIITLGCSKNTVDSEKILAQLPANRFKIIPESNGIADVMIINTCGFIQDAKTESIDTILEVIELKNKGLTSEVLVTGCLSERYMSELKNEIPEVNAWFGVKQPGDIFSYLKEHYVEGSTGRFLTTPPHYAYLKIAEGCDRTCSFCAIPMIRGAYRSTPVEKLTEESRLLADKGVKELILIAQDLTYYGYDISGKPMLAKLLEELINVDGIEWIRLHYAYPHNFPIDVLDIMAANNKICNYLDVPLQHVNDKILKSMRRGHDKASVLAFLDHARKTVKDLCLRTTLMVGYPGETEAAFQELADFVSEQRFDRLGVFTYSPEDGTRAFRHGNPIPEKIKKERIDAIMNLQAGISLQKNRSRIGQQLKAIIDRQEGDYYIGRSQYDSPEIDNEILIKASRVLKAGYFENITINGAEEFDLFACV